MKIRAALAALLLTLLAPAFAPAFAQSDADKYPSQTIRLVVPSGAGGITDVLARILSEKLGGILKQSVVVDNKAGASGVIGSDFVVHARPDGYTLLMAFPAHTANPSTTKNLPYDTVKDFAPITKVGSVSEMLLVPNDGAANVKALIEQAKKSPQPLVYGSVGNGSLGDLATLIFQSRAKIKLLHVAYKSEPEIVTALIRGDLQFAFSSPPGALPMLNAGRIKAIAISDLARSPILPNLPTVAESGLPDFNVTGWNAIFAPAATPPDIIARLNKSINQALADPGLIKQFLAQGVRPIGCTPEVLQQSVVHDIDAISATLKAAGISPQ
jgi:tripartite-type tricarboxylate transporter receptor subunit TctC